jgi:hypothetical protein
MRYQVGFAAEGATNSSLFYAFLWSHELEGKEVRLEKKHHVPFSI